MGAAPILFDSRLHHIANGTQIPISNSQTLIMSQQSSYQPNESSTQMINICQHHQRACILYSLKPTDPDADIQIRAYRMDGIEIPVNDQYIRRVLNYENIQKSFIKVQTSKGNRWVTEDQINYYVPEAGGYLEGWDRIL